MFIYDIGIDIPSVRVINDGIDDGVHQLVWFLVVDQGLQQSRRDAGVGEIPEEKAPSLVGFARLRGVGSWIEITCRG